MLQVTARDVQVAQEDWDLARHLFDIYLSVRRFDSGSAQLLAGFAGSESEVKAARKSFDGLAGRLGALKLGVERRWPQERFRAGYRRDTLLDRGAAMDSLVLSANWSKLPSLYVAVRTALKQAMRSHPPRPGAHGLVLCRVSAASPEGATLTFTWLFPRILDGGIAQAQNIRQAALAAARPAQNQALEREVLRGIKQTLDPKGILNPGLL